MKFYTVEELSKMLSLSIITIRRNLKSGVMTGSKLGHQWRVSEDQLKEYFDKNSNKNISK